MAGARATLALLLLDTRSLSISPEFGSDDFEAYAGLLGSNLKSMMDQVAASDQQVTNPLRMEEEPASMARTLYYLLVQMVGGRALKMLRTVPNHNGLEAWRRGDASFSIMSPQPR